MLYTCRFKLKSTYVFRHYIEHYITFWSKLSVFLSAVTLKIRSRSQSPYQVFNMSMCCIHANFGQNPVIRSGYIVHILMLHTNISADTDTDADGIRNTVYASNSNLLVGYMNCHIAICSTNSMKKKQNI